MSRGKKATAEPKRVSLGDLLRRVLLWRADAISPLAAVTRRELGLRSRKVRADNRVRQARRRARVAARSRRAPAYR